MNYYNEFDPKTAAWLRELIVAELIPPGWVDQRSIKDVRATDLLGFTQCHFFAGIGGWSLALRLIGWPDTRPVWTGSCPCQPFAGCGKRLGTADPRHLWPDFRNLIAEGNAPVTFGEQVASEAGRDWLAVVRADLEALGYAVGAADLCAAGVGASQCRQRLYWVADPDDARREGAERTWQPDQAWQEWPPARGESLRSNCGPWPPGPREVGTIPVLADGLPGVLGRCRGYGNAIVPPLAAEFISAYLDTLESEVRA